MAPSIKSRNSKRQARPESYAFRVTKSAKLNVQPAIGAKRLAVIEEVVHRSQEPQSQLPKQEINTKKRRRNALDSDDENEEGAIRPQKLLRKARSTVAIPTPPASSPEPEELAATLRELKSLHKAFVQALAVHYAHHGTKNAALISALLSSMTRLWKRRTVCPQDVQRILAVWEMHDGCTSNEIAHKKGPFKLIVTGIGSTQQTKIEYVWQDTACNFLENELHQKYETAIENLFERAQRDTKDLYRIIYQPLTEFPLLECEIGAQTQARQEKIHTIRDSILSKSIASKTTASGEPDFATLSISDPSEPPKTREDKLKSRTLGLFDRLRAKQLANSASGGQPTSAELVRRRALHRIPDILDVLRLKQSQKLNSLFRSDMQSVTGGSRTNSMKVSFSLEQLIQEIRDSGRVPTSPEEIRACLEILGREVPDTWCSVYSGNGVKCVTLQGEGWRKEEVQAWCEKEVANMGTK